MSFFKSQCSLFKIAMLARVSFDKLIERNEKLRHMKRSAKRGIEREKIFFRHSAFRFNPVSVENNLAEAVITERGERNFYLRYVTAVAGRNLRLKRFCVEQFRVESVLVADSRKKDRSVGRDFYFEILPPVTADADENFCDVAPVNRLVVFVVSGKKLRIFAIEIKIQTAVVSAVIENGVSSPV